MEYARLIGELMLKTGYYDEHSAAAQASAAAPPAPQAARRAYGAITKRIREVLDQVYPNGLVLSDIALMTGLEARQVHRNMDQMKDVDRTGERGSYEYRLIK